MTISGGSALPKEEIERMVRDAEVHAEEDRKRREDAETRNQAEQLVWSTEKFVKDNEEKIPAEPKAEVEQAVSTLKEALASSASTADLKAKTEALATASQKIGQAMYAAEAASAAEADAGGGGSSSSGSSSDDDVVDAEVVDEEPVAPGASGDQPDGRGKA